MNRPQEYTQHRNRNRGFISQFVILLAGTANNLADLAPASSNGDRRGAADKAVQAPVGAAMDRDAADTPE